VTFPVLFVCIYVLNNCHRVATQLQLNKYIIMSPAEFEPTISAGKRPQNYALDRATTGTGSRKT
jgi:hypothetical protein